MRVRKRRAGDYDVGKSGSANAGQTEERGWHIFDQGRAPRNYLKWDQHLHAGAADAAMISTTADISAGAGAQCVHCYL